MATQPKIILRPPPHRDFLAGFPGIPSLTPPFPTPPVQDPLLPLPLLLRPQAHLSGTVEVRPPPKGVKAQYLTVELEKIESIPGVGEGGKGKKKEKTVGRFTELIGIGPGTLWVPGQDGSGEEGAWGDIPEGSYPFRIPLPEGLPPTSEVDLKGSGISYQLVASLSIKGKRGLLKSSSKPLLISTSSPIILLKSDILPIWPIYSPLLPLPLPLQLPWVTEDNKEFVTGEMKEGRGSISGGGEEGAGGEVWVKCVRERGAVGPGDAVKVRVMVGWGGDKPIKLTRLDFVLRETLLFRHPTSPPIPPRQTAIFTASASVSPDPSSPTAFAILYPLSPLSFDLVGVVPTSHTRVTIRTAKHVDVSYHLKIRAMFEGGEECAVDGWGVVVGGLGWREAKGLAEEVGWVEGLCERGGGEGAGVARRSTTISGVSRIPPSSLGEEVTTPSAATTEGVTLTPLQLSQRRSMLFPTTTTTGGGTDLTAAAAATTPPPRPQQPTTTTTATPLLPDPLSQSESRPLTAPPPPPKSPLANQSAEEEKRRLYQNAKNTAEQQQREFRVRNASSEDVGKPPASPMPGSRNENGKPPTSPTPFSSLSPGPPPSGPPPPRPISPNVTSPLISQPFGASSSPINPTSFYSSKAEEEKIRLFKEAEARRDQLQSRQQQMDRDYSLRLAEDEKTRLHLEAVRKREEVQDAFVGEQLTVTQRLGQSSPTPSNLSRSTSIFPGGGGEEKRKQYESAKALARQRQEEARLEYERQNALLVSLEEEEMIREEEDRKREEEELEEEVRRLEEARAQLGERLKEAKRRREGSTLGVGGSGSVVGAEPSAGFGGRDPRRVVSDTAGAAPWQVQEDLEKKRAKEEYERRALQDAHEQRKAQDEYEARLRREDDERRRFEEDDRRRLAELEMRRIQEEENRRYREEAELRRVKEEENRREHARQEEMRILSEQRRLAEQHRQAEERRQAEYIRDRILLEQQQQQHQVQQSQAPPTLINPPFTTPPRSTKNAYDRPTPPGIVSPSPQLSGNQNRPFSGSSFNPSEHSPSFALGMETSRPMSGASFAPSASLDNADTNFYMNAIGSSLAIMSSSAAARTAYIDSLRQRTHHVPTMLAGIHNAPSIISMQPQASSPLSGPPGSSVSPVTPTQSNTYQLNSPQASYIATPLPESPSPLNYASPQRYTSEPDAVGGYSSSPHMTAEEEKQLIATRLKAQDERAEAGEREAREEQAREEQARESSSARAGKQVAEPSNDGPPSYPIDAPTKQMSASEEKRAISAYMAAKAAVDDYTSRPNPPPPRQYTYSAYPQSNANAYPTHEALRPPTPPRPERPHSMMDLGLVEQGYSTGSGRRPSSEYNTTPRPSNDIAGSASGGSSGLHDRDPAVAAGKRKGPRSPKSPPSPLSSNLPPPPQPISSSTGTWYNPPHGPAPPTPQPERQQAFLLTPDFGNFSLGDSLSFEALEKKKSQENLLLLQECKVEEDVEKPVVENGVEDVVVATNGREPRVVSTGDSVIGFYGGETNGGNSSVVSNGGSLDEAAHALSNGVDPVPVAANGANGTSHHHEEREVPATNGHSEVVENGVAAPAATAVGVLV